MKILVVADTPGDRAHLRKLVRQFPQRYAIDEAGSGQAALERIAGERYHCVLLDYALHDMTAAQVLTRLDHGSGDAPPVILLSDGDDETALHRCLQSGAQDYLLKPVVSVPVLGRALRAAIERQGRNTQAPSAPAEDRQSAPHNAAFFRQHLRNAIERAVRQGRRVGVVLVELRRLAPEDATDRDDSKDAVVNRVLARLSSVIPNCALLARLGSNELAVLIENVESEEELCAVAEKVTTALDRRAALESPAAQLEVQIRTAIFPGTTIRPVEVSVASDSTMHPSPAPVSDGIAQPAAKRWDDREQQHRLRHRLSESVTLQPFSLHYQPRYRMPTRQLEALEGLMRWDDEELGTVPPMAFIPICERNGMISLLGRIAVERAREDWARYLGRIATGNALKLSLNLSPVQLLDEEFLACLTSEVSAGSPLRGRLQVEVSDKAGIQNSKPCMAALEQLATTGIDVAIDDFGAGSTSVAQLTSMPVRNIILDSALTDRIAEARNQSQRIRALIAVADSLGVTVTAKRIETAAQLNALVALGCHYVQGNALATALAPDELEQTLRASDRKLVDRERRP